MYLAAVTGAMGSLCCPNHFCVSHSWNVCSSKAAASGRSLACPNIRQQATEVMDHGTTSQMSISGIRVCRPQLAQQTSRRSHDKPEMIRDALQAHRRQGQWRK